MAGLIERRTFTRGSSRLCSRNVLVNGLRFVWVVVVVWCEVGIFFWSVSGCKWPDKGFVALTSHEKPMHILLIADAQVRRNFRDYSLSGAIRQYGYDSYLAKSWNVARRLNPHAVVFLGDMLSSGRHVVGESEYEQYLGKFRKTFPLNPSVPVYYLPGNEDVGLGITPALSKRARQRYLQHFGQVNQQISLKNHTFVLLDAPGLVEEDYQRAAQGKSFHRWIPLPHGPVEFVKSIASDRHQPVILLSHIPLSRPETASCGPLRERGTIRRGVGHGYQSTLGKHTTAFLLENLRPAAVFSADDRDYCEYTHSMTPADPEATNRTLVKEVTVKSFSATRHIRWPGFQLLSIVTPTNLSPSPSHSQPHQQSFADMPCFLPSQRAIYTSIYAPFCILTLFILLGSSLYHRRHFPSTKKMPTMSLTTRKTPRITSRSPSRDPGPWEPISPSHKSPNRMMPRSLRTPNSLAPPTFRALSRPATPIGSPLLSPMVFGRDEEDDQAQEDMHPAQYAMRRDRHYTNGDWSPGHDDDHMSDTDQPETDEVSGGASYFFHVPGDADQRPWSWTFTFRGRRRRMAIRIPSWSSLRSVGETLVFGGSRRGSLVRSVLGDVAAVGWVVLVAWIIFGWWMT